MIRSVRNEDAARLAEIYNWYIENTDVTFETEKLNEAEFVQRISRISKRYPYLVLEEEESMIGYAYLGSFNERAAYDWTADLSIYLDHNAKGKGYGSKLMTALLDLAVKDGYVNLVSIVTSDNRSSCAIHEKFGFVNKALFKNFGYKHNRWLDVYYFVKNLRQPASPPVRPLHLPYE